MDRDPALWPGGDGLRDAAGSLVARTSSLPPHRSLSLAHIGGPEFAATADANTSSNLNGLCADEWIGSHVSLAGYGMSETTSTSEEGHLMLPDHIGTGGHRLSLGGAHGDAAQSNSGNRTQGLSCPTVPFGAELAARSAHHLETRPPNAHSFDVTADHPMIACPPLASDVVSGLTWPAETVYPGEERIDLNRDYPSSVANQGTVVYHTQEVQRQAIPSRARDLTATAPPAMAPFRKHFSSDTSQIERVFHGQEWSQSTLPYLQGQEDMLRLEIGDVSLHYGPNERQAMMGDSAHNPMWGWGLPHDQYLPPCGLDSREFYVNEFGEYDSLETSGAMSSLGSNQSLPGSTLTSSDAWLSRTGDTSLQDATLPLQDRAETSGYAHDMPQRSVFFESNNGQGRNSSIGGEGTGLGCSSEVASVNLGGGRVEEGCIGTKKRIWYRAPNGQFASATQALFGHYAGEGHDNKGQSSSTSSGGIRRIRRRRKSEEVERKYRCDFDGCDKAYGTLNHLNTHRATNKHGPRLNAVGYRKAYAEWERRQMTAQRS
ncbi:hypothetical protein [Sporisorium scitamineum]|uniref:C2H2-type domain-containing protein n=1 Tax=Sporisorium scitamineum TaxID=49012 RepID=A0A0F7SA03_9BASI|nr:hypothetical protein [Sporisorium scitamineum]